MEGGPIGPVDTFDPTPGGATCGIDESIEGRYDDESQDGGQGETKDDGDGH